VAADGEFCAWESRHGEKPLSAIVIGERSTYASIRRPSLYFATPSGVVWVGASKFEYEYMRKNFLSDLLKSKV